MKATSFWTGTAAPTDYGPCRTYVGLPVEKYSAPRTTPTCPAPVAVMSLTGSPVLAKGATGPYVVQLQTRLKIMADGVFGSATAAALTAFQTAHGLPATGSTDDATWGALRTPVVTPQAETPPVVTPVPVAPKPTTSPSPKPTPTPKPTVSPKPVPVVVLPNAPLNKALAPYAGTTLAQGAKGAAVVALQKALHLTADGAFGPKTAAAVSAYNRSHGLGTSAVATPRTWRALGAPAPPPGKAGTRRWLPSAR
jgi:peptidoglycan hydrolase-like protein with peptidoglycan-binding domain